MSIADDWYVLVEVTQLVDDAALHPDDVNQVAGSYAIKLLGDALGVSTANKIESALDVFHDQIGIHTLDDFSITTRLVTGALVPTEAQELGDATKPPRNPVTEEDGEPSPPSPPR